MVVSGKSLLSVDSHVYCNAVPAGFGGTGKMYSV